MKKALGISASPMSFVMEGEGKKNERVKSSHTALLKYNSSQAPFRFPRTRYSISDELILYQKVFSSGRRKPYLTHKEGNVYQRRLKSGVKLSRYVRNSSTEQTAAHRNVPHKCNGPEMLCLRFLVKIRKVQHCMFLHTHTHVHML